MAKRRKKRPAPARAAAAMAPEREETASAAPLPARASRERWLARGLVALAAALAFGRSLAYPLLADWDDDRFLLENPLVQEPSLEHFVQIFAEPHFQAYHPLHLLSYWLDVPFFGTDGPAIHAVSLALFALALVAVLEACWALRLGLVGGIAATLIVGLHPVQVEAVVWATGRKDVLALGFAALAILFHVKSERLWDRWAFASLAAYGAACLSKTTALPLPVFLVAADALVLGRAWRSALLRQAPALLVATVLGVVTVLIWSDAAMLREGTNRVSLVLATLTHHLGTAIWPSRVSPLYPIDRGEGFGALALLAGVVALGLLAVAAWRARDRALALALIGFVVLIAPVSNVFPLYYQWQDRYLSLPLLPLAYGAGALLERIPRRALGLGIAAALALALGARSAQYAGVWRDGVTLFGHAAATQPDSFYAWLKLGHARRDAGHLEGAIAAYSRATEAANLALAHESRFRAVMLLDERRRHLAPSRVDEMAPRYHAALEDADRLRLLAGDLAEGGYRGAVMLCLDQSFVLEPVPAQQLEHAALVQLRRGNYWLSDYYVSRLARPPVTPELRERAGIVDED